MEDYKLANIQEYAATDERVKFRTHPSKIVGVESFRRRYKHLVAAHERVLDLGGGAGIWTEIFREEGTPITTFALDISRAMLHERAADDLGILGDIEQLPCKDESVDRVCFFASLHHVKDTRKALEEARRVVRTGGHVVISEPTSLRLLLLGRDIEPVDDTRLCFSILHVLRLLQEVGLEVTYTYYQGFFRRLIPIKNNLAVYRGLEHLDNALNRLPLVRKLCMLGNYATIVAQKR